MPAGAKPLSLALSSKGIALYALVDPDAEAEVRNFIMVRTGETFPASEATEWTFIGTIGLPGNPPIHVFQVPT